MQLTCLDNAINLLLNVHSNLSIFFPMFIFVFKFIYFSFSLEISNFVFHLLKRALLCNPIGFVDCPLTVSGASCFNSRYMHVYH